MVFNAEHANDCDGHNRGANGDPANDNPNVVYARSGHAIGEF